VAEIDWSNSAGQRIEGAELAVPHQVRLAPMSGADITLVVRGRGADAGDDGDLAPGCVIGATPAG
jgi:hypothetical protein